MEQVGQMQIMETVQASRSRKLEICTGASKDGTHHRVSMGRQESSHRCTHIPRLATWNTRGLGVIHAVNINTPVTHLLEYGVSFKVFGDRVAHSNSNRSLADTNHTQGWLSKLAASQEVL